MILVDDFLGIGEIFGDFTTEFWYFSLSRFWLTGGGKDGVGFESSRVTGWESKAKGDFRGLSLAPENILPTLRPASLTAPKGPVYPVFEVQASNCVSLSGGSSLSSTGWRRRGTSLWRTAPSGSPTSPSSGSRYKNGNPYF